MCGEVRHVREVSSLVTSSGRKMSGLMLDMMDTHCLATSIYLGKEHLDRK